MKGGLFGSETFNDIIKKTKKSEIEFINKYEEMERISNIYHSIYVKHLENLGKIDEYVKFTGMTNLFKKVILKDNIKSGRIDKSNPLLFSNYYISSNVTPAMFRREHILRQVHYMLHKIFARKEHVYIKNIDVSDITSSEFTLNITTLDNKREQKSISHDNYIINKPEIKDILHTILTATKQYIKRPSIVNVIDDRKSGSHKSHRSRKSHRSHKSFSIDLNSVKTKKKSIKSNKVITPPKQKLSLFMTEREKREAKEAKEIAAKEAAKLVSTTMFTPQLKQTTLDNKPQVIQTSQSTDPEDIRCSEYSGNYDNCKANKCRYLGRDNICAKKDYPPQFGAQPPQFGAQPQQFGAPIKAIAI